jgi:predicted nucleic acid-binding protein
LLIWQSLTHYIVYNIHKEQEKDKRNISLVLCDTNDKPGPCLRQAHKCGEVKPVNALIIFTSNLQVTRVLMSEDDDPQKPLSAHYGVSVTFSDD